MPQIFIKTLRGKTIVLDFNPDDTILDLKQRILTREGIDHDINCFQLYRIYQHKQFDNNSTLGECGLVHEDNLRLGYLPPRNSPSPHNDKN